MRDRIRQEFDGDRIATLQQTRRGSPHLGHRCRDDRFRDRDAVGGNRCLGFGLGQHAPAGRRRLAEDGTHRLGIARHILAPARRHPRKGPLRQRPGAEVRDRRGGIGWGLETGHAGFLQNTAALAGSVLPKPAGQERLGAHPPILGKTSDRSRRVPRRCQGRRTIKDEDHIGAVVIGDGLDRRDVTAGRRVADDVDRVCPRPSRRQSTVQP